jgi:hypothetical protein
MVGNTNGFFGKLWALNDLPKLAIIFLVLLVEVQGGARDFGRDFCFGHGCNVCHLGCVFCSQGWRGLELTFVLLGLISGGGYSEK